METIIETKGLTKRYGQRLSVSRLDLSVPTGCVYGFLGPNGAGKSTTMKMILGLVKPTEGRVKVLGAEMNSRNRLAILKNTGSLIESPAYYGHLSGKENLQIVCTLKNISEKEISHVLAVVRLENQQHKKVSHYSLGMKQRLGLACALLGRPKLLLLDEPTNGLDPAGIQEIRELIISLPEQYGMTVLVSSHLLGEIDQMADQVGIIDQGKLIFQDRLEALHEHSRKKIYIRTMNQGLAEQILSEKGIVYETAEEGLLLPEMPDARIAGCVSRLVSGGVGVIRVEERQKNLEEIFLGLTGNRSSL